MVELEGLDVSGSVTLEELFDLLSKSSFTAGDVHVDGYWLPLKAVSNNFRNQLRCRCSHAVL